MPEDRRHTSPVRKLAAVMFTDIVGYTKLMGSDEDKAFEILKINREIHTLLLKRYNGTLIKEMGDGILASFSSNSDAVRCAIEIQQESKTENIKLRIGIHEGEMVFAGADVLGDGVNVASRLEELAEEGCINVSGAVYKDIRNKADIITEFIEEKTLKNVDEPVKVYKIFSQETNDKIVEEGSSTSPKKPSIAVLPFVNMSADPEQEYFCDGMTEEIINALSHVENLKVIARTSAFMFKEKHEDIREIGKKLDVGTLLEGSVRKAGNRIRITAQLIKVSDGSHLWSERYDRDLKDIFAIQDEISLAIVANLKVKLLDREKKAIEKRYTDDFELYNLYLKGIHHLSRLTTEGCTKAQKYFEQTLQKKPDYALAYYGLGAMYFARTFYEKLPPNEGYPKAKLYFKKALDKDNTLAEALCGGGVINMNYDRDWKLAENEFKYAFHLNPNSVRCHSYYSWYLTFMCRHEEAIKEINQAKKLDPLSSYVNTWSGIIYQWANQFDYALKELQMTIEMDPYYFLAYMHIGQVYIGKSMFNEAIEAYEKAAKLSGGSPMIVAHLAVAYYLAESKEKADNLIKSLKQRSKQEYVPPICFWYYSLIQGDNDQAFKWLERAVIEHDSFFPWAITYPIERCQLPDEPRFNKILEQIGLKRRKYKVY